jgi:hypothetical protein
MDNHNGLELQLFEWEGWDEIDTLTLQFYKVVLKVPIGDFQVGHKFASAVLSGENSVLQLFEDDSDRLHEFELKLSVGNKLS